MRGSTAWIARIALAAAAGLGASPVFAVNGTCLFQAKGLSLNFGTLDPSSGATVTVPVAAATLNADTAGDCKNVTMTFSADNGQHFSSSRRMTNGTDFIPYNITVPTSQSAPGNNRYVTFTFSGTVQGTAYQNASAGSYTDTVTLTVSP